MAIDYFTNWIETKVLLDKKPRTTQEGIMSAIVNTNGKPDTILTDCVTEFTAQGPQKYFKDKQIIHKTGPPYTIRPQGVWNE